MPGPLHGVRILELTSVVLGPWACQILGDLVHLRAHARPVAYASTNVSECVLYGRSQARHLFRIGTTINLEMHERLGLATTASG